MSTWAILVRTMCQPRPGDIDYTTTLLNLNDVPTTESAPVIRVSWLNIVRDNIARKLHCSRYDVQVESVAVVIKDEDYA